jgi:hypothetical protein
MNKADVGGPAGSVTYVVPDTFCSVDRTGATDMGTCINQAISASKHCGAPGLSVLRLTSGLYNITTPLVPQSCVTIIGDGRGKTVLLTNSASPFVQQAGVQLVHFSLYGVTFRDGGSNPGATVMTFRQGYQGGVIENIGFHGYTSGTLISSIANGTVTTFSDTLGIWNSSNSFMNIWRDIILDDQAANGIIIKGNASTPCDFNTVTNVNTLNTIKDIQLWGITRVGVNFAGWGDSNMLEGVNIIRLTGSGAAVIDPQASFRNIAVQIGDDNAACVAATPTHQATNNDSAIQRIAFTTSMAAPATSMVAINFGNASFANQINYQTDITPDKLLGGQGIQAQPNVPGLCYSIDGRNWDSAWDDLQGNLFLLELDACKYHSFMDGTKLRPSITFTGNPDNGFYHPPGASNIISASHMLRADQGFIAAGAPLAGIAGTFIIGNGSTAPGTGTCPSGTIGGQTVQGCMNIFAGTTARVIPFF